MTYSTLRDYFAPTAAFLALTYLAVMWAAGARPVRTQLIHYEAKGVMAKDPASIVRVSMRAGDHAASYERRNGGWIDTGANAPLPPEKAKALSLAVKFMHSANPVRVFKASEVGRDAIATFGLAKPKLTVRLVDANGVVLEAAFGNLSSDGFLHYMRVKGRDDYYLMSRFVLAEWQKIGRAGP